MAKIIFGIIGIFIVAGLMAFRLRASRILSFTAGILRVLERERNIDLYGEFYSETIKQVEKEWSKGHIINCLYLSMAQSALEKSPLYMKALDPRK